MLKRGNHFAEKFLDAQIKEKHCATKAMIDALHASLHASEEAIRKWLEKEEKA